MKQIIRTLLLFCLIIGSNALYAQGGSVYFGYGLCKFQYRPANLDIVRFNVNRNSTLPMDMPEYLRGMSVGIKQFINENATGEYRFTTRQQKAEATNSDSLGNISSYALRCRISSLSVGGAVGIKYVQLGYSVDINTISIASRINGGSWDATFSKKRKIWFGHTLYASFMLPLGKVITLEIRPYWQTSWFSVRMGSEFPLKAFRPSNYGIMFAIGLGGFDQ